MLHESASCAALLPCGLLPEELEELESLTLEADLIKSAAAPGGRSRRGSRVHGWERQARVGSRGEAACGADFQRLVRHGGG